MSLHRRHPGLDTVRDLVAAQCAREGITSPRLVDAAIAKRQADPLVLALLSEDPNLHGAALLDLLKAPAEPAPGAALEARNEAALEVVRVPIYRTRSDAIALANRTDEYLKKHTPAKHARLAKAGGSSVAVTSRLMREQAEREASGDSRGAKAKK